MTIKDYRKTTIEDIDKIRKLSEDVVTLMLEIQAKHDIDPIASGVGVQLGLVTLYHQLFESTKVSKAYLEKAQEGAWKHLERLLKTNGMELKP